MIITITDEHDGVTVKEYLFGVLSFSSAAVKRVKYREGGILVNGERVTVRRVLHSNDVLTVDFEDRSEDENAYTVPVDIPIKIVYEDDDVTVVDKPPLMPSHPSLGHKHDTVANALAYRYRSSHYVFRPVNRLDRDTSGLMLIARNKISAGKLYKSMMDKKISKSYTALLSGRIEPESGTIETYICREGDSIVKRRVCDESSPGAKIAVTEYTTVRNFDGYTLVNAVPVTGRTHQLRVHFSHRGCPIVGDTMYGDANPYISRQALHASRLSFPHPSDGRIVELESALPDDIVNLIENITKQ